MKTIEISKATAPLSEYANLAAEEPIVVTADGKPLAALIFIKNTDLENIPISMKPRRPEAENNQITDLLNRIYETESSALDPVLMKMQAASIEKADDSSW